MIRQVILPFKIGRYFGGKERSAAKISKNIATDWSFLYP
jgi:hypothetical protein